MINEQIAIQKKCNELSRIAGYSKCVGVNPERLGLFSIAIIEIIRDNGSATNLEIRAKLGQTNNYIKQYLYRLQRYGIIFRSKENWKWYLEDLGDDFFLRLDTILYIIYKGNTKVTQREHKGNVLPLNKNDEIKKEQNAPKQISFAPFLTDMNDDVLTATKFLISHYERTNQPFVWIEKDEIVEFSEQVKIPPDRIQKTIEDLKSEKIAYLWYDKVYMKWALHLYKDFIERARHV